MIETLFKTEAINDEAKYCVYCHRNKINNKRYIGQTIHQDNLDVRWGKNGSGYKHNNHFKNAIDKYGWDNFEHIILAKNLSQEEADELETYYISLYNTTNRNYGYNYRSGGREGSNINDESKQKIAQSLKKYHKEHPEFSTSHDWSDESRQKLSESLKKYYKHNNQCNKGKTIDNRTKEKISNSLKDYYKTHTSIHKNKCVSEDTKQKISNTLKGKYCGENHPMYGKHWSEEVKQKMSEAKKDKCLSEEHKQHIRESCKGNNKGRVYINDGNICKFVKQEELQQYLSDGWKKGRLITKNKETINYII